MSGSTKSALKVVHFSSWRPNPVSWCLRVVMCASWQLNFLPYNHPLQAYVVAAFETLHYKLDFPKTKAQLLNLWDIGSISTFRWEEREPFIQSKGSLPLTQWKLELTSLMQSSRWACAFLGYSCNVYCVSDGQAGTSLLRCNLPVEETLDRQKEIGGWPDLFDSMILIPRYREWSKGHGPTNHAKWRTATKAYVVCILSSVMEAPSTTPTSHAPTRHVLNFSSSHIFLRSNGKMILSPTWLFLVTLPDMTQDLLALVGTKSHTLLNFMLKGMSILVHDNFLHFLNLVPTWWPSGQGWWTWIPNDMPSQEVVGSIPAANSSWKVFHPRSSSNGFFLSEPIYFLQVFHQCPQLVPHS